MSKYNFLASGMHFSKQRYVVPKCRGFTLIELVTVIAMIGVLLVTILPKFTDMRSDARRTKFEVLAGSMKSAVQMAQMGYYVQRPKIFAPGSGSLQGIPLAFVKLADGKAVSVFASSGTPTPTGIFAIVPLNDDDFSMNWSGLIAKVRDANQPRNDCMLIYYADVGRVDLFTTGC